MGPLSQSALANVLFTNQQSATFSKDQAEISPIWAELIALALMNWLFKHGLSCGVSPGMSGVVLVLHILSLTNGAEEGGTFPEKTSTYSRTPPLALPQSTRMLWILCEKKIISLISWINIFPFTTRLFWKRHTSLMAGGWPYHAEQH